jgi:hypothetical protein
MGHLKIIQIIYGMKKNKLHEKIITIIKRLFTKQCCR